MFCFTAAAATASAPAAIHHHVAARADAVRRESGGESREHERDGQDLAVDLVRAEQGRHQEHRSGGCRADHDDPGTAREAAPSRMAARASAAARSTEDPTETSPSSRRADRSAPAWSASWNSMISSGGRSTQ